MPCPDFVNARPEKSVPPKKSWRSHNITFPEHLTHNSALNIVTTPDSGENLPLNMGPNNVQSDLQNDNGHGFETPSPPKSVRSDMPLDFSLKTEGKSCRPEDRVTSPQPSKLNCFDFPFRIPNGERNGSLMASIPNGMNPHFGSKMHKSVQKPVKTIVSPRRKRDADYFNENNLDLSRMSAKFSDTQRTKSPSPRLQSPSSSSKSPILAGMLAGSPPDMFSPVEVLNSRLFPIGLSNGYSNGFNTLCVPGGIQNPSSVMASSSIFPPSNIISPSGLTLLQSQMNLLSPVSPIPLQSKMESKAARKGKQERPFKNYDVSLQDDISCNSLAWPAIPSLDPRAIDESSPPDDARRPGSATVPSPTRAKPVNGHSENSLQSDPPSVASEVDNTPHSSVPSNALEEGAEMDKNNRSRKRRPVAESQKDASYWERRTKNNQAAKRSRENRRIKEDTVAQQATYFRNEVIRLTQLLLHLNARLQEATMKCVSLEQDKLALTAENAMLKQALSQQKCEDCGRLANTENCCKYR